MPAAPRPAKWYVAFLVIAMLASGAINTITKKYQMNTCSVGIDAEASAESKAHPYTDKFCQNQGLTGRKFNKPWFQNGMMFIGEMTVLLFYVIVERKRSAQDREDRGRGSMAPGGGVVRPGTPAREMQAVNSPPRVADAASRGLQTVDAGNSIHVIVSPPQGTGTPINRRGLPINTSAASMTGQEPLLDGDESNNGSGESGSGEDAGIASDGGDGRTASGASILSPDGRAAGAFRFFKDRRHWFLFAFPALCDVCGTGFGGVGLVYVSMATWQMMRGSIVVFTAIMSVIFLKKKLYLYNWFAVFLTLCGLSCVGYAAVAGEAQTSSKKSMEQREFEESQLTDNEFHIANQLRPVLATLGFADEDAPTSSAPASLKGGGGKSGSSGSSGGLVIFGMMMAVGAQMFSAGQMVVEELYVKRFAPSQVVGAEGCWGLAYMLIILTIMQNVSGPDTQRPHPTDDGALPDPDPSIHRGGSFENSIDSFYMLSQNSTLVTLTICYMVSIAFFNFMGVTITKNLSAIVRTLIDALRTGVVWCVDLILFRVTAGKMGEDLTVWSLLKLFGFLLCLSGTLMYKGIVKLPGVFYYPPEDGGVAAPAVADQSSSSAGADEEVRKQQLTASSVSTQPGKDSILSTETDRKQQQM